jgi:hypothetical protein
VDLADRIEIYGSRGVTVLSRKNNVWYYPDETALPVKQARAGDLLAALSRRERYTPRAVSEEGSARLWLTEAYASRITVRGGAGLPLLDLLVGRTDALGREVFLRRAGKNETFSGEDRFTFYTESDPSSWLDFRLFPAERRPGPDSVQQADVYLPWDLASSRSFTLRRSGSAWVFPGNEGAPDTYKVESWLRSALEAEAEGFSGEALARIEGSVTLHLGDGTSRAIQAGPAIEPWFLDSQDEGHRLVAVAGSFPAYVFSEWAIKRLFRERDYFLRSENPNEP